LNTTGKINPDSLKSVREKIHQACKKSNRRVDEVQIIAVTKTFGVEAIESALDLGIICIGENKVQEVEKKIPCLIQPSNYKIHFIGHLQTNKIRKILKLVNVIETIDSTKLANRVDKVSQEMNIISNIYLQVNTGNDPNKFGFKLDEIMTSAEQISKLKNLNLSGIMTIPPNSKDTNLLKIIFNKTRKIRDQIQKEIDSKCINLSMGMSKDFETAIECGATHIRLGTILFGKREFN
jgi:PLP dependent protein